MTRAGKTRTSLQVGYGLKVIGRGEGFNKCCIAVTRQLRRTNSNTRYLHPFHILLAQRLLETFQPGSTLREDGVCFFVNSGSEANELALRLANTRADSMQTIVIGKVVLSA